MAKIFDQINADARPGCTEYAGIDFTGFSPFTICGWFKTSLNATECVIACKWGSAGQYLVNFISKKIGFYVRDSGTNRSATAANDYNGNTWNHFAGVFDGSAVKIKINGGETEDVTGGTVVTGISNTAENFTISQFSAGGIGSTKFAGSVEHICIFNRALSNGEIKTVMRGGPSKISGLTLWFPMIVGGIVDTNLAPDVNKTAVTGSATSYTLDTSGPPTGLYFGSDITFDTRVSDPGLTVTKADDLAQPWTDALITGLGVTGMAFTDAMTLTEQPYLGLGLKFAGENLAQPWTDALTYNFLAPSTPLSVVIVDKIIRNGSINGNNLALRDGIGFSVGPSGPVFVAVSDLGTYLDDSNLGIGYGLAVAD